MTPVKKKHTKNTHTGKRIPKLTATRVRHGHTSVNMIWHNCSIQYSTKQIRSSRQLLITTQRFTGREGTGFCTDNLG